MWGHVKRGKWVPPISISMYPTCWWPTRATPPDPGGGEQPGGLASGGALLEYTNEWQMDGVYAKLLARARELLRNA